MEENIWEQVTDWDHVHQFDTDEFVIIDNSNSSEASIFPPDNHQDLPLTTPEHSEEDSSDKIHQVAQGGDDERWKKCLKIINSGIFRVAYKFRYFAAYVTKLWPLAAAAAAGLVLIVLYQKGKPLRRRPETNKDHWMLLSREKDQKINHLLLQIAKMNEILSASQRVPVHRVV